MTLFMSGVLVMGYAVSALFFARFWKDTRDRLFLYFAFAFALLAVQRGGLALSAVEGYSTTWYYLLRLFAFLLILAAIVDKNRRPAS